MLQSKMRKAGKFFLAGVMEFKGVTCLTESNCLNEFETKQVNVLRWSASRDTTLSFVKPCLPFISASDWTEGSLSHKYVTRQCWRMQSTRAYATFHFNCPGHASSKALLIAQVNPTLRACRHERMPSAFTYTEPKIGWKTSAAYCIVPFLAWPLNLHRELPFLRRRFNA